jgi:hypothetical protein
MSRLTEYLEKVEEEDLKFGSYRVIKTDKTKNGKEIYKLIIVVNKKEVLVSEGTKKSMIERARKEEEKESVSQMHEISGKERNFGA